MSSFGHKISNFLLNQKVYTRLYDLFVHLFKSNLETTSLFVARLKHASPGKNRKIKLPERHRKTL